MKKNCVNWIVTSLAFCILVSTGCGSSGQSEMVPVRGEVFFNGKPLKQGTVIYSPSERGVGRQASGGIQSDGTFVLTTFEKGDGVKKGDYRIAVYALEAHPGEPKSRVEVEAMGGKIKRNSIVPGKYANPATSGLSDTVDDNHSGFIKIELDK